MRPLSVLFTITITFIFSGCVASQSPQIANIDKINSFRDYVIQKKSNEVGNYDVVATTANKTLLELRMFNELTSTANATDVLKVLDDVKTYCSAKGGYVIYGDGSIFAIENLPTAFSFDYIGYKNDMQKQGSRKFDGFLKCTNSNADGKLLQLISLHLKSNSLCLLKKDRKKSCLTLFQYLILLMF